MFLNVARVRKNCKLDFSIFSVFLLSIRIMYIEMLVVFQRVESIHETQAWFSLEYQNVHTRYIQFEYPFLRKLFYE